MDRVCAYNIMTIVDKSYSKSRFNFKMADIILVL